MNVWLRRHHLEATLSAVALAGVSLYTAWILIVAPEIDARLVGLTITIFGVSIRPEQAVILLGAYLTALISSAVLYCLLRRLYAQIEQAREQAIRQETIMHMAAVMAHEVFQPLTVIQAGVQFLCVHQVSSERRAELCRRVVSSTKRLAEIIRQFENTTEAAMREHGSLQVSETENDRTR